MKEHPVAPATLFLLKNIGLSILIHRGRSKSAWPAWCLSSQCAVGKWKCKKIQPKFINLKSCQSYFSLCANPGYTQGVYIWVERRFQSTVYAACIVFMHSCVTFSYPAGTTVFSVTYILLTFSCWDCIEVLLAFPPGVTSGDRLLNHNLQKWYPVDIHPLTGWRNYPCHSQRWVAPHDFVKSPHDLWAISVWWAL